jgi:sugar lactone lactonase YvrE
MMINHFNAFISYKHAELDNKIAASIVRDLEHFHIPKKIQKSTGMKRIERIFRDKDELPITSDLGDTISQALFNADFLIVICSHNTKKSTWVEREIEYFLRNHSMDRILTVLCEGEPSEVIPKVLLTGTRTLMDENGVEHTEEIPFEPLSCDYRMPYRKARAEELPRLAAALIGCSYDELINRQRQYRMRRLTAVFAGAMALALGFSGYMLYSNTLIQKNYLESLKNQSRYLGNESEKLLSKDNRTEAAQLALQALPGSEQDERPITPEAERAITKASLAYVSLEGGNVAAVWNYRMPGHVSEFYLSEEGSFFAARDNNGVVMAWRTDESHKLTLYEENAGDKCKKITFLGDDRLIMLCEKSVASYDLNTGEKLWKISDQDRSLIYVDDVLVGAQQEIILPGSAGQVEVLSAKDGSVIRSFALCTEEESSILVHKKFMLTEDGKKLIYVLIDKSDVTSYKYKICLYDLTSEEKRGSELPDSWPASMISSEGNIYVSCKQEEWDSSVQLMNFRFVTEDTAVIKCFSSEDLTEKWSCEMTSTDVYMNSDFLPLAGGKIAYYEADTCVIFDAQTGEKTGTYNVNDTIVDISDNDGDGVPMFVTRGGATGSPSTFREKEGVSLIDRFSDNLTDALVGNGVYTLGDMESSVIYYGTKVYDEDWTLIEDVPYFKTGKSYYMDSDVLALINDKGDGTELIFVDPKGKTFLGSCTLSEDTASYNYRLLGAFNGAFYTVSSDSSSYEIIKTDLATMKMEKLVLDSNFASSRIDAVKLLKNGSLAYVDALENSDYRIVMRDLSSGAEKTADFSSSFDEVYYLESMDKVYVDAATDLIVDMATGNVAEMKYESYFGDALAVTADEEGRIFAVSGNESIKLIDSEGEYLGEILCGGAEPLDMAFVNVAGKELLVVAYRNGNLYRYDPYTGEFVGKGDLTVYSTFMLSSGFEYDSEQGLLYVRCSDMLNIVETDTWVEVATIRNCFGHDKETDTFLTYGYDNSSEEGVVGYFKHYSVEELVRKAKDYLHGEEMTPEQKSMYGISG